VFVLQSILNGIYAGSLTLDGMYGIRTIAAVQEAQRTLGLAVDGICGPKTWARLENG
jgi:peptidoglycan hydrolase-like protein with peptidoglycan-binding domain